MRKIISKEVYEKIQIKIYLQQFLSVICQFYHLFEINYKIIFCNWNISLNDWFIHNRSVTEVLFAGKRSCLVYTNHLKQFFIFILFFLFSLFQFYFFGSLFYTLLVILTSKTLIVLIPFYPFPSLNQFIKLSLNWSLVSHMEIVKQCLPENNLFGQRDHTIDFIDCFQIFLSLRQLYHYIAYLHYSFFFVN